MPSGDLLDLVIEALDEFDAQPLDVTVRRAYRIARLRGDSDSAARLYLEMKPIGGSISDRIQTVAEMYPGLDYETVREKYRQIVETFIEDRRMSESRDENPNVLASAVSEVMLGCEFLQRQLQDAERDRAWQLAADARTKLAERREVLERIRVWVFDYLTRLELQLASSDTVTAVLARHRAAVDRVLEQEAPVLRDQLQAALRAARQEGDEARSQVLTTARRVLMTIADHLYPASDEPHISADGAERAVSQANYRNRILAGVEIAGTADRAFGSAMADLAARLDQLDELLQKGVHADVSVGEMEFGLAQTYLLSGELLRRGRDELGGLT